MSIEKKLISAKGADVVQREMRETFGFVPDFIHSLPPSALAQQWAVMRDFGLKETALTGKVKELVGLAVAAHIKCKYCIYFHSEAARAFGATDDELRESAYMGGYTVQWSNAITGAAVDFEQFKGEVDRAIAFMLAQAAKQSPTQPTH